ncbi:MAG: hypothetical protein GEV06_11375 [Luteitalea sp.]|nr:hypothetical protein [Luteitalea sp.]
MKDPKELVDSLLDRREFNAKTVLALLSGVTITVSACDGDDGPTAPSPPGGGGDITGTVSANHGHRAVLEAARLAEGDAFPLDIRGDADHPHTVELTAAEVMRAADGERVSKSSTTDAGHTHTVTFNA